MKRTLLLILILRISNHFFCMYLPRYFPISTQTFFKTNKKSVMLYILFCNMLFFKNCNFASPPHPTRTPALGLLWGEPEEGSLGQRACGMSVNIPINIMYQVWFHICLAFSVFAKTRGRKWCLPFHLHVLHHFWGWAPVQMFTGCLFTFLLGRTSLCYPLPDILFGR